MNTLATPQPSIASLTHLYLYVADNYCLGPLLPPSVPMPEVVSEAIDYESNFGDEDDSKLPPSDVSSRIDSASTEPWFDEQILEKVKRRPRNKNQTGHEDQIGDHLSTLRKL